MTQPAHGVHTGGAQGPKIQIGQQNLDTFVQNRGLVVGERVDHLAANQQLIRAEELRELIALE